MALRQHLRRPRDRHCRGRQLARVLSGHVHAVRAADLPAVVVHRRRDGADAAVERRAAGAPAGDRVERARRQAGPHRRRRRRRRADRPRHEEQPAVALSRRRLRG